MLGAEASHCVVVSADDGASARAVEKEGKFAEVVALHEKLGDNPVDTSEVSLNDDTVSLLDEEHLVPLVTLMHNHLLRHVEDRGQKLDHIVNDSALHNLLRECSLKAQEVGNVALPLPLGSVRSRLHRLYCVKTLKHYFILLKHFSKQVLLDFQFETRGYFIHENVELFLIVFHTLDFVEVLFDQIILFVRHI